jgi:hypothetical protein
MRTILFAVLPLAFGMACQSLTQDVPSSDPAPSSGVVSSAPVPISAGTSAPPTTPSDGPTPAPTNGPDGPPSTSGGPGTAPPWLTSCSFGAGSGDGTSCTKEGFASRYWRDVQSAIDKVIHDHPEYFYADHTRVRDGKWDQYYWGVMQNLHTAGFCANFDGENIGVKAGNDLSEGYHVLISDGTVWRGAGSWVGSCVPAWF